jgi:predicted metalloprotease with PDZ domain
MKFRLLKSLVVVCLPLLLTCVCLAAEPIHYELGFERPNTHLLDITIRADGLDGKEVAFAIPYWAPGVYIVEQFAVNVQGFHATDAAGRPLPWRKSDSQTWQIDLHGQTAVVVRYQIYADGMPIRGAQYDERHAGITGAAVWMYMVSGKERAADLKIDRSSVPGNWKIATGMRRADANTYAAPDYDSFADCPIEISDFVEKDFVALGTTYHVVVHDEIGNQDFTKFITDMHKVIETSVVPTLAPAVKGPLAAPFADYWFLIHISPFPAPGAGVEHLNSTMIVMSTEWDDHSPTTHDFLSDLYENKIDLATHEFFHAWNVKRLRPKELGPFDYAHMVHTQSLWISEGLTNYFTSRALLCSGFWSQQNYLDYTARVITGLEQEPGRKERSIADTSWDTWFGFSGGGSGAFSSSFSNNLANTNYSYYDGGEVLGWLLDLEIRHATENRKSIVDWMRLMYERYSLPKAGFEPEDAVRAASEIAGKDMSEFFARYVTGKEPLPYENNFSYAGIRVEKSYSPVPWLGIAVEADRQERPLIVNVIPGSPAERDGLDRGDAIVALDGKAVDASGYEKELKIRHAGDRVMITVVRNGQIRQIPVVSESDPYPTYALKPIDDPTDSQKQIYRSLMSCP